MLRKRTEPYVIMDTKTQLLDIIQDYVDYPVEEIETDKSFKATAGVDSFVFIEMVGSIEDRFGISIPNGDLKNFTTINDIVSYIDYRKSA